MTEVPKTTIMKIRRVVEERWIELDPEAAQEDLAELAEEFDEADAGAFDDADDPDDDDDDED